MCHSHWKQMKGRQQEPVASGMKMICYFTEQSPWGMIWADSEVWASSALWGSWCEKGKSLGTEIISNLMSVFIICC